MRGLHFMEGLVIADSAQYEFFFPFFMIHDALLLRNFQAVRDAAFKSSGRLLRD